MDETRTTDRRAEVAAGALFLLATISYLAGSALVETGTNGADVLATLDTARVQAGSVLELVTAAAAAAIAVVLYPVLRRHGERLALAYLAGRLLEAALLGVSVLFVLALVPLDGGPQGGVLASFALAGYDVSFQLAMVALAAGSIALCVALYRGRLVPRPLALLGLAGYLALGLSAAFELAGQPGAAWLYAPGALFEIAFPIWLIARGLEPEE